MTHLTQCWARDGRKRTGGHPLGLPGVGETGSGDGSAALGVLRKGVRPAGSRLGQETGWKEEGSKLGVCAEGAGGVG